MNFNYYQSELKSIQTEENAKLIKEGFNYSLKISGPDGTSTKHLKLTEQQLQEIYNLYGVGNKKNKV